MKLKIIFFIIVIGLLNSCTDKSDKGRYLVLGSSGSVSTILDTKMGDIYTIQSYSDYPPHIYKRSLSTASTK